MLAQKEFARLCCWFLCVSAGVNRTAEDYLRADDNRQSHFSLGRHHHVRL